MNFSEAAASSSSECGCDGSVEVGGRVTSVTGPPERGEFHNCIGASLRAVS